jgi:flagellar biosynthesis/type III secretory pathway ATPase
MSKRIGNKSRAVKNSTAAPSLEVLELKRRCAYLEMFAYNEKYQGTMIAGGEMDSGIRLLREQAEAVVKEAQQQADALVKAAEAQAAEVRKKADWLDHCNVEYQKKRGAQQEAHRESWWRFAEADRAVAKAGGEELIEGEDVPGVPEELQADLESMEELARRADYTQGEAVAQ